MKHNLLALLLVLTAVAAGTARSQESDVALVNLLSGDVTYLPRSGISGKVQPFMKIRQGDRIDLAAASRVRIVFFEGARQELWSGPASFRAGETAAEPISGQAAEIIKLPADAPQRMARVPQLLRYARLGGSRLRGMGERRAQAPPEPQTTPDQARAAYETMRKHMPADDIVPELYLYAALYEHRLYDEMKAVVAQMRRKQPDNEDAKALEAWLASRTSR